MVFNNQNGYVAPAPIGGWVPNPVNCIVNNVAPSTNATGAAIGTVYVNSATSTAYLCVANTGVNGTVTWDQIGLSTGTVGSLTPDTGTSPVTPSGGNINLKGTASQITTTGTANQITLSIPTTFVAPGTVATTSGYVGQTVSTAPSAGNLGEQIRASVTSGATVTMTTSMNIYQITSVNLTAGIWDVSAIVAFSGATQTLNQGAISTSASTLGVDGDSQAETTASAASSKPVSVAIPAYRVALAATTTYYLTASSTFSGSAAGYGRISATRVA
jgi:hypothetical protein